MNMSRKLYCFSHQEFDELMMNLGWENRPENGTSTISISSPNDEIPGHWFNIELNNNINLDFDDLSPEHWWQSWVDKNDYYDLAFDNYINNISDDIIIKNKVMIYLKIEEPKQCGYFIEEHEIEE